jgi:hypothetical protein
MVHYFLDFMKNNVKFSFIAAIKTFNTVPLIDYIQYLGPGLPGGFSLSCHGSLHLLGQPTAISTVSVTYFIVKLLGQYSEMVPKHCPRYLLG